MAVTTASPGEGYLTDVAYIPGFYPNMAPLVLRHVATRNRVVPPPATGYGYLELGCGLGRSLTTLAAANPDSEFVGVDINPQYAAVVERDVAVGRLANIRVTSGDLCVRPEFQELFRTTTDRLVTEAHKDFCANTAFRRDVYGSASKPMPDVESRLKHYDDIHYRVARRGRGDGDVRHHGRHCVGPGRRAGHATTRQRLQRGSARGRLTRRPAAGPGRNPPAISAGIGDPQKRSWDRRRLSCGTESHCPEPRKSLPKVCPVTQTVVRDNRFV